MPPAYKTDPDGVHVAGFTSKGKMVFANGDGTKGGDLDSAHSKVMADNGIKYPVYQGSWNTQNSRIASSGQSTHQVQAQHVARAVAGQKGVDFVNKQFKR